MVLQAAACMTGIDLSKVRCLPDSTGMKNEILYSLCQRITYFCAFEITGARLMPIGEDARSTATQGVGEAFTEKSAPIAYVLGRGIRCSLSLGEVAEAAPRKDEPSHNQPGSMAVACGEPQEVHIGWSGLGDVQRRQGNSSTQSTGTLCGRKELMDAAYMNSSPNYRCIGRPMKCAKKR